MDFDPGSPIEPFVAAAQAHDVAGLVALTSPDVVLRSPITTGFVFRGHDQLTTLMEDVWAVLPDQRYTGETGNARTRVLQAQATIDGLELHEMILIEVDDAGLVESMELFMRPMPAVVALAAALGPRVARRRSPARGAAASAMFKPLAVAMRRGEGVGVRLARPPGAPSA
jgi:hypothetical protein